jgi:hypothetical protein
MLLFNCHKDKDYKLGLIFIFMFSLYPLHNMIYVRLVLTTPLTDTTTPDLLVAYKSYCTT